MTKQYSEMKDKELLIDEIYAHLDGIDKNVQRMTSGNYMHNTASIRFSVSIIKKILEELGIKEEQSCTNS